MKTDTFAVVMAGGSGTRFWPRSRSARPKQFLEVEGGRTLLQQTIDRIPRWIGPARTLVVTAREHLPLVVEQTGLPPENVLAEPMGRDTAPCVALAALEVRRRSPEALMAVMAADHRIKTNARFARDLALAVETATERDVLVTFGIKPARKALGFGWIEKGEELRPGVFSVTRFVEKPDEADEAILRCSGRHFWNSGIFVWRARVILAAIEARMPALASAIAPLAQALGTAGQAAALDRIYPLLPKESIDRGVLQKHDAIACVAAGFRWDDVGSFGAMARHVTRDAAKNAVVGEAELLDAKRCIVDNRADGVVALIGVKDLVVIRTADAVLVVPARDEQRVKELVQRMQAEGRTLRL